jgi:asparagine synthase (glutamine-hydrolysing)
MSIFAGIYSRKKDQIIPDPVCSSLREIISRNKSDEVSVLQDARTYFARVDIGTFNEPGQFSDKLGFSFLSGNSIISESKTKDLTQIHQELSEGKLESLKKAAGVFNLANYQFEPEKLTLVTDKLGIRPLYFWSDENFVVFSTSLRVLERLEFIPKRMNVRAVTEIAAFGYPLKDRTPFQDIYLLRPGEIVQISGQDISRQKYWDWDQVEVKIQNEETLLKELYEKFETAVARRLGEDKTTVAYLSGGLDSRCIVSCLDHLKAKIHTFNFARPNTQDQIFGREFAQIIEAIHTEIPKESGDHVPDYSSKMAEAWSFSKNREGFEAERPNLVWSGEGGSVALGHVHLSSKIIELMREGKTEGAIDEFIGREQIYLSPKLLTSSTFKKLSNIIRQGIKEELEEIQTRDAGRKFYLFLMLNDQHRKLANHFENIDLHRLEFQLPFFDSDFIGTIVAAPIDLCLGHKLYIKFLDHFPKSITAVPWQAYPGHEPCPLPIPEGLSYQWDNQYQKNEQKSLKRNLIERGKTILNAEDFPNNILSKKFLWLALLAHWTGLRDYGYLIEGAGVYHKYWRICQGKYQI